MTCSTWLCYQAAIKEVALIYNEIFWLISRFGCCVLKKSLIIKGWYIHRVAGQYFNAVRLEAGINATLTSNISKFARIFFNTSWLFLQKSQNSVSTINKFKSYREISPKKSIKNSWNAIKTYKYLLKTDNYFEFEYPWTDSSTIYLFFSIFHFL